jgi:acetyl esterase/lipase
MPSTSKKGVIHQRLHIVGTLILLVLIAGCNALDKQTPTPTIEALSSEGLSIQPVAERDYLDQVYCTVEGVELRFDLSYPPQGEKPYPLVIYVHGGSWREGDKRGGAGMEFKEPLLNAGYAFASIDYRLSPDVIFPAHIQDVKCAVRYFRANASQLGVSPDQIVALGGSAGAHLVALLGLTANQDLWEETSGYPNISSEMAVVVDLFGPTDLSGMTFPSYQDAFMDVFGEAINSEGQMWSYSPLAYVSEKAPPFLILYGNADKVVALHHSERLYHALQDEGVPVELIVVRGGGHSLNLFNQMASPSKDELTQSLLSFLDEYLGD